MAKNWLEDLLFLQGNRCFFCNEQIPAGEASVEHLVATSKGGLNVEENCVACCKSINALLGDKSLKEKLRVLLNQRGDFKCPRELRKPAPPMQTEKSSTPATSLHSSGWMPSIGSDADVLLADLERRKAGRPKTLKTLTSTATALFQKTRSQTEIAAIISELRNGGKLSFDGADVSYSF